MLSRNLLSILSTFLLFTVFASAWSWPNLSQVDPHGLIHARQNNGGGNTQSGTSGSSQPSQTASSSPSRSGSNSASGSGTASITASGSSKASGSASGLGSGVVSGTRVGNSTKTAVDPRLPPGGIQMVTPAPTDGMTFVKVGDQITFAWNYTSLSVPPSYVDVVATNTVNHQTYTIAANTSWDATQTVVWDTSEYTQSNSIPFVVASYTLMVYDSNNGPTSSPTAGYLGAFSNLIFGIYTPQPYVDLNEFKCATCSGAMSIHEKQALSVILGTCAITILSFTWFASGFGLF